MTAPLRSYAQTGPARVVSSIDIKVLTAQSVVVGRIAKAVPGDNASVDISIAVDEVFRGDAQEGRQRNQERGQNGRFSLSEFSRMSRNKVRVLVIGQIFVPLDKTSLVVPTVAGVILRNPDQIISYVRDVVRNHPGTNRVEPFLIPLPRQFQNIGFTGPFEAGVMGPARDIVVPVDADLEKWAIETIRDRSSPMNMSRALEALKFFKSAPNIERVKELLQDSNFSGKPADLNNGIEVRAYGIRQQAYTLLKNWAVEVNEPVLREEIPRFATLETLRWQGRPIDTDLQKFVDAGQLKALEITSPVTDSQLALIGRIPSLTRLTLRGLSNASLKNLRGLLNLQELDVGASGKITDEGLAELASLTHLTRLVLASTRVADDGLILLTRFPSLKFVDLTLTQTTNEGLAQARKRRPDLVVERADRYWTRMSPFASAAFTGDTGAIRKYIQMRFYGSDQGGTPAIIFAVGQDHLDVVKLLLDNKTRVDLQDAGKNTPIQWAAHHGYTRIVKLLLDRGANVNHADAEGYTALHFAAKNGKLEVLRLLLAAGANRAAKTNGGLTPLDLASRNGRDSARTLLLETPAN